MKNPKHTTRKERKANEALDTAIASVGDTVKKFAGIIVQALDVFIRRGLSPAAHVLVLSVTGDNYQLAVKERNDATLKLGDVMCEHVMLVVSTPAGLQGCCPECDYDVRGRKTN